MTKDIIEAVARAIAAHFVENTGFITVNEDDEKTTVSAHYGTWIDLRVYPIARAAITAYEAARGDVVVVPREPTEAMLKAALARPPLSIPFDARTSITADYRAMIAASQGER